MTAGISVIMATYNQAGYLRQALDTLSGQSLPRNEFEVIVINDGSTDQTSSILAEYSSWIRIVSQENQGLVASCNAGLRLARGQYFTRLDSDDYVDPDWLSTLSTALKEQNRAVCVVPDLYEVYGAEQKHVSFDPSNIYSLQACGTMFRTEILRRAGGFRPFYWEEYDLYLRLRSFGEFVHVPRPLYFYRRHPGGMTSNSDRRIQGWIELGRTWGFDALRAAGSHVELDRAFLITGAKEI